MEHFVFILEMIGTVAFAVSGAMIGIEKKMDVFGVAILGLTTAVGGGIIRDLIIGNTPPQTFRNPSYAIVSVVTALVIFLLAYYKKLIYNTLFFERLIFVMDTLGLGIFTVVGISTACETSAQRGHFLLIFVGVITGVGGGVLRDMMAGDMPYIFRKHVYACASLAGAIVCAYTWELIGMRYAMLIGTAVVVVIRFLAVHYRWNLPRA